MKQRLHNLVITKAILLVAFALPGCGHKENDGHAHKAGGEEPGVEAGMTYSAKQGLRVSPDTAKFIGLQVADVEERKIAAAFQFSAQVYRASTEAQFASLQSPGRPDALASGNVSSTVATKLSQGQRVSVQAAHGVSLAGHVVAVKRDLEIASGQIEVLLAIADEKQPLASGEFVFVEIGLGGEKDVVSVPRSALFRTTEGDFVYTVSGEHFMRTPVKPGVVNHDFVEITDGLYAGDQIVVQPVMTLWLAELQSLRGGKACADGH